MVYTLAADFTLLFMQSKFCLLFQVLKQLLRPKHAISDQFMPSLCTLKVQRECYERKITPDLRCNSTCPAFDNMVIEEYGLQVTAQFSNFLVIVVVMVLPDPHPWDGSATRDLTVGPRSKVWIRYHK